MVCGLPLTNTRMIYGRLLSSLRPRLINCRALETYRFSRTLTSANTPPPSNSEQRQEQASLKQSTQDASSNQSFIIEEDADPGAPPPKSNFVTKYLTLSRPIEKLILRSRLTHDIDLARFVAKACSTSIYGLLGISVLGTLGVDTNPIIAGIGITGFTVGFALKEIATNFLSGVFLVFSKPFQKGQHLKIMGPMANMNMEGQVESIDARYVLLRTKDKGLLLIPSVIVYTNPILVTKNGTITSVGGVAGNKK